MGDLQFQLLGPFQVWRGDLRLDAALSGRLARELLAYLVLERGRLVPAERLMDVFWPHLDPRAAANNLQGLLVKLRRALEPELQRGRDSRYLVTQGDGYRLLAAGCGIDLDDFAAAARAGEAALRGGDASGAVEALRRARDAYRGELLADLPYAEWAFPARERLREDHLESLEALGEALLGLRAFGEALEVAQQGRTVDPLRECFVRQEMRALAAVGERAQAIAASDELEGLLEQQLGIGLSEETRALREAILAGSEAPAAPAPPGGSVELPLVGRADVVARLEELWREGGGLVLLAGEAGLGKTRLLTELTRRLDAPVLWSQAREGDPPFAAALGLVEGHLRRGPPAAELERLGPLGAPLAQRLPLLRELWPECPAYAPLEGEAEEQRLGQAVLAALELAVAEPAVLVLDDLHWADEKSVSVLAEASWPEGVLLVGAYRSDEAAPPLAGVETLELAPLSAADVLAAVRGVIGLADPVPLSRRLHEATGGQPLFLTEMLRGLLDEGQIYRDARGEWHLAADLEELPPTATLREAVLARAAGLDRVEREVLDAASVLRPRATGAALREVLRADGERVERALESLSARRWLRSVGEDGWEFGHQLTGEAVYTGLAPAHRSLLHRLAASALIAVSPAEPGPAAAEIAAHLEEGAGPPAEVARWGVLAGRWAAKQLSYSRAEAYFELARSGLDGLRGDERRALALAVHEGLGTVQPALGKGAEGLRSLERALSFADAADDRARLLAAQARIRERDTGEYDRAMELLAEAEELLGPEADPGRLAEIHTTQADVLFWRGEHEEGSRLAAQAAEAARGTPLEPDALRVLANHLQKLGRQAEAVEIHSRMLRLAETAGDLRGLAGAHIVRANGLVALGRLAEARAALEQAGDLCERLGNLRGLSIQATNAGMVATALGDLDGAETALRRAIELAEQAGAPYTVAVARNLLGRALTLRGRMDDARRELEAAVALAGDIEARVVEAQARVHLGLWHRARGEAGDAGAQAELALAVGEELGDNFCRRESRLLLGTIAAAAGDAARAEHLAREALEISAGAQQVLAAGRAERLLGVVLRDEAHLAESEAIFRRSGAPVELGETLLTRGTPEDLREARRLFRRAKARPLLKQAEQLLGAELSPG